MKTIFGWFFTTLLGLFIGVLVFVNLYMFIIETYGYQYNILGVPLEQFRGGYFGFRSIFLAISDFPTNIVSNFVQSLFDTTDALTGGVPKFIASYNAIGSIKVTEVFKLLSTLVVQPLYLMVVLVEDLLVVFQALVELVVWFFKILGGAYNIENFHNYPYPI